MLTKWTVLEQTEQIEYKTILWHRIGIDQLKHQTIQGAIGDISKLTIQSVLDHRENWLQTSVVQELISQGW